MQYPAPARISRMRSAAAYTFAFLMLPIGLFGWLIFPLLILFDSWRTAGIIGTVCWYLWAFIGTVHELRRLR